MNRSSVSTLIIWLLGLVMAVTLFLNLPDGSVFAKYTGPALIYALVTAAALYFGALLSEGEFSVAHSVGVVALLAYPLNVQPMMLWSMFFGGFFGGILLMLKKSDPLLRRRLTSRTARSIIVICARLSLSFLVGAAVFQTMGGEVPLQAPIRNHSTPLIGMSVAYCVVYIAIFLLETYADGRSLDKLWRRSIFPILILLILPIPFAILSAQVIAISNGTVWTFASGATLITIGLHIFSRMRYQLHTQIEESRTLSAVSRALQSDFELQPLLRAIHEQVTQLLKAEHFTVAFYDPVQRELSFPLVMRHGQPVDVPKQSSERTLLGRVLEQQSPLLLAHEARNMARQLRLESPSDNLYSWLGVPLLAGGRLLGAIAVASDDPTQGFKAADQRLLSIVATSAGAAIANAQYFEQQATRANQLATLNRVASLLTGTLAPDAVLDAVASSATVVTEATAVAVYLVRDDLQVGLMLVRTAGLSELFNSDPIMPLIQTPRRAAPVFVQNAATDERVAIYRAALVREGKQAWAELPLEAGDSGLGVIQYFYNTPQTFNENDVEILRAFATQAAQAIKNARQYSTTDKALERRVEQMYALATLGRQLTATMNLRSICNLVLGRAMEVTVSKAGYVILREDAAGAFRVETLSGYPLGMPVDASDVMRSTGGRVLQTGQAARVMDLRGEPSAQAILAGARAQLIMPILRSGQILGAIGLESDVPAAYTEEDSYFVTQLANQTIIAMDNTRLFERIAEARDRLQVILNAMTEGIVLVDRQGIIALANPRVKLLGLQVNTLLNQPLEALLERPDLGLAERMGFESDHRLSRLVKELRAGISLSETQPFAYSLQNDGETTYLLRHIIPVGASVSDPLGVLLVFYDQTEERELAQMRDDLGSMIVHDLRSPLTAVTTGIKLMRDIVPKDISAYSLVESTTDTSQRAIRKLLSRVDSLLDISKMENGQIMLDIEPTSLKRMADNVINDLGPLAQDLDVKLSMQFAADLPTLAVDSDKIERVLQNLVDNALKFSPSEGSVTIQAVEHEPGWVRVGVADTGPGVPDEYKGRLFDRYVQIKGRRGNRRGIGLGLTFCRMTVEAHGGRIWIMDNPTGGSIFSFTVPIADLDPEAHIAD
jgi:NtrC-family two-component system sensor histidine kinase KinB